MIWTKIKRVIKSGTVSFARNGSVSIASTLVMTVTLSVIASLLLVGALLQSTLKSISEKVDVNVYLESTSTESQAMALKQALESRDDIISVDYTSPEKALEIFRERHIANPTITGSLEEVGDNPLEASLNILATDPSAYQDIADFIENQNTTGENIKGIVNKVSYIENKEAIDTLSRITASSKKLGFIVASFFIIISILITFNTVRLAIYTSKDEIAVMRLVGASSRYIKGPFIIIGGIYGFISSIITIVFLYPITYWLGPTTYDLGTGLNIFNYYLANFLQISMFIISIGIVLGIISSYLAVRKYIKI